MMNWLFTTRLGQSIQWLMTDRTSDFQGSVQMSAPARVSWMIFVSEIFGERKKCKKNHLLFLFIALAVKADVKLKVGITLEGCPADKLWRLDLAREVFTGTCMAQWGRRDGFCQGFVGGRVLAPVPPSDSEPWASRRGRPLLQEPPWWEELLEVQEHHCQALLLLPHHLQAARHRGAEQPVAVPCNEMWI